MGAQTNAKTKKYSVVYEKVCLPYHVQKHDGWTKRFTTSLSSLLSRLHRLLLGGACYCLGKVIVLLEIVGSAFSLCRKEVCHGSPVLQTPTRVEGSGGLHGPAPPLSAQALGKMWAKLFFTIGTPAIIAPINTLRALLLLINSNTLLPLANYNTNEPGRRDTREIYS